MSVVDKKKWTPAQHAASEGARREFLRRQEQRERLSEFQRDAQACGVAISRETLGELVGLSNDEFAARLAEHERTLLRDQKDTN